MRWGVLDVGSNTVHLLVVDAHVGSAPLPAHSRKYELRLAEHLGADGSIGTEAVADLCEYIAEAQQAAEDYGCIEVMAFATSAIREASNGEAVLRAVADQTGVVLEVLSGDDEARLTFLAARRWYGWSAGRLLVLDIGGGSLEMAIGGDETPEAALSLPLGAGRLTMERLDGDPPAPQQVRELRRHVRATIASQIGTLLRGGPAERAVATSKTFRQLARITGAAPSNEGPFARRILLRDDLRVWLPKLAEMDRASRTELPGVSPGRAGQLLAGAVVAEAALDLADLDSVEICPWALREGVILRRIDGLES